MGLDQTGNLVGSQAQSLGGDCTDFGIGSGPIERHGDFVSLESVDLGKPGETHPQLVSHDFRQRKPMNKDQIFKLLDFPRITAHDESGFNGSLECQPPQIIVYPDGQPVKEAPFAPRAGAEVKTIGKRLRWVIERHLHISQADFSRKIGKSRQLVNRWLNDPKRPPAERNIEEIADVSGVSLAWLRYGEGDALQEPTTTLDPQVLESALNDILQLVLDKGGS